MLYIVTGKDQTDKDAKVNALKAKIFKGGEPLFDCDTWYVKEDLLKDKDLLRKSLLTLPAMSSSRLVIVRQAEKLDDYLKEVILKWLDGDEQSTVMVLDFEEVNVRSSFYKKLAAHAKVLSDQSKESINIFDVTNALERRDGTGAIKMLEELLEAGNYPLQLIGGLLWFWGKYRRRLSEDKFKKGLLIIQEADLNIKRSRVDPAYAMEIAVTKLFAIIAD